MEIVQGISVTRISETASQSSEFLEEFGVLAVIAFKLQTKLRTISNHKTTTHLRWKRQFIRIWAVSIFHQRTIKWIELDEWPFWLLTKASVDSFGIDLDYAVWKRQSAYPAIKSPVVTRDLGSERVMTKILTELWGWWSFGDSCRCSSKSLMNLSVLPNLVIIQKGCYPPFLIRQKNIWSFSKKILPFNGRNSTFSVYKLPYVEIMKNLHPSKTNYSKQLPRFSSWRLNQPLWKNIRQNGFIFPKFRGENSKKSLKPPPRKKKTLPSGSLDPQNFLFWGPYSCYTGSNPASFVVLHGWTQPCHAIDQPPRSHCKLLRRCLRASFWSP